MRNSEFRPLCTGQKIDLLNRLPFLASLHLLQGLVLVLLLLDLEMRLKIRLKMDSETPLSPLLPETRKDLKKRQVRERLN